MIDYIISTVPQILARTEILQILPFSNKNPFLSPPLRITTPAHLLPPTMPIVVVKRDELFAALGKTLHLTTNANNIQPYIYNQSIRDPNTTIRKDNHCPSTMTIALHSLSSTPNTNETIILRSAKLRGANLAPYIRGIPFIRTEQLS